MELVIDKELLSVYFDSISPKQKNEEEQKLVLALESEKNRIKISSDYLEVMESFFKQKSSTHFDFFQSFITSLSDENRLISFKSENEFVSEEEELEIIHNYEYKDYTFSLIKSIKSSKQPPNIKMNLSVFDNVNKPNKDWFILSLSSCFVISLDYSDFSNQKELNAIFEVCSKLTRTENILHIMDSYFTLYQSTQLAAFKGNGLKIKCYTSSFKKNKQEINQTRNSIKSFFGQNASVSFSSDKSVLHERKIMLGSLIIDSTHDFSELTLRNHNWNIYFLICEHKQSLFLEKIKKYN